MSAEPSAPRSSVLVVEDDEGLQRQLRWTLAEYEVSIAADRATALAAVRRAPPAVITLDLGLPPDAANASEGLAALSELLDVVPHAKIIVVTGNDDRNNALEAIGRGAYDFYQKPIDPTVLRLMVDRAARLHALEAEYRRLSAHAGSSPLDGVIAASAQMLGICQTIEKVAPTGASVLLLGESGTGKELLARALHQLSGRRADRFVAINCAAIPENLLESELFGYEKGAFTGATKQTRGKLEYADEGTLLLDEVGDLPQLLQAKLLRFLQERVIERVGGRETIPLDVRVICATHKDLVQLSRERSFREDLYYRIAEIVITIPPLRARPGDAVLIARALIQKHASALGVATRSLSDRAVRAIEQHGWAGNVRELENRVKRGLIMASGRQLEPEDMELDCGEAPPVLRLAEVRARAEIEAMKIALVHSNGQIGKAAQLLGISRPTFYHLMRKHDFEEGRGDGPREGDSPSEGEAAVDTEL